MTTTCTRPQPLSSQEQMALERVLESFEKLQTRSSHQYSHIRKSERRSLRTQISIFIPSESQSILPASVDYLPKGWCYSLSQGGLGFVSQVSELPPRVHIGWHLPNDEVRWLSGEIVRCRAIPEEAYWDYGFKFQREV